MQRLLSVDDLFSTFSHHAFRLETLPEYCNEPEWSQFCAYQSGDLTRATLRHSSPQYLRQVHDACMDGKTVERVRFATVPFTAYLEYEIELYRFHAQAGERVRMLLSSLAPVTGDFWLFDDEIAALLHHDREGRFLHTEIVDDAALVEDLIEAKADLLDWSEPIEGYWNRYWGTASMNANA